MRWPQRRCSQHNANTTLQRPSDSSDGSCLGLPARDDLDTGNCTIYVTIMWDGYLYNIPYTYNLTALCCQKITQNWCLNTFSAVRSGPEGVCRNNELRTCSIWQWYVNGDWFNGEKMMGINDFLLFLCKMTFLVHSWIVFVCIKIPFLPFFLGYLEDILSDLLVSSLTLLNLWTTQTM